MSYDIQVLNSRVFKSIFNGLNITKYQWEDVIDNLDCSSPPSRVDYENISYFHLNGLKVSILTEMSPINQLSLDEIYLGNVILLSEDYESVEWFINHIERYKN